MYSLSLADVDVEKNEGFGLKLRMKRQGQGPATATAPTTGGRPAETGADAATSWDLGGAGIALAMGAALVAGTGRRRPTP